MTFSDHESDPEDCISFHKWVYFIILGMLIQCFNYGLIYHEDETNNPEQGILKPFFLYGALLTTRFTGGTEFTEKTFF